ncbi:dipeptidase PepV [Peptoniphilus sp. ING2-D1G]|nr:dipeptidase PepV [Peptoniphilus sp. ING2-D1G]
MKLEEYVERQRTEMINALQDVIRIKSVREDAKKDAPYGQGVLDCLNHVLKISEEMGFKTVNVDNYMGYLEYGEGKDMVAILGHLDVVPEGTGWSVDPYGGHIKDDNIYGRGAIDDKGPVIASLYALKALKESALKMSKRIRILFGTNEETGSEDMKYYLNNGGEIPVCGFTPDGEYPAINGEKGIINVTFRKKMSPKGDLRLLKMEGGTALNVAPANAYAEFSCDEKTKEEIKKLPEEEDIKIEMTDSGFIVRAKGKQAHGSTPEKGKNAIGTLLIFLNNLPLKGDLKSAVEFLAERIGTQTDGKSLGIYLYDEVSKGLTLNMGVLKADENSIEVKINYRYPVTKSYEDCAPKMDRAFAEEGFEKTEETHKKSLYIDENTEFLQTLLKVYEEKTGNAAKPKSIGGGTYAKAIPNIVAYGPIFPGDEVREHLPDEYIEIDKLMDNAKIYAEAMYRLAK